jgi:metacaspase-1
LIVRKSVALILFLAIVASSTLALAANRALLVGINKYPDAALQGCVNDIRDMGKEIVTACGFRPKEIRILTDSRATTAAIKSALTTWLVKDAKSGDRLLFHFSGHGSTMTVGDTLQGCICPVDFDFTAEHAITASDFETIFAALPAGVVFNWFSDSCFSGDLAKTIRGQAVGIRAYPMIPDMQIRIDALCEKGLRVRGFAAEHLNGAYISGCEADGTSADAHINGRYCGAATYALLKELKTKTGLTEPLTTVVGNMNVWLDANGYEQNPQIRGDPAACARAWLKP